MDIKSYKKFSKIMVDIRSKRDYIITNPNIIEKDVLRLVRLYDYILDEIENSYDLIIKENKVNRNKIDIILGNIINRAEHILEDKNGKNIQ